MMLHLARALLLAAAACALPDAAEPTANDASTTALAQRMVCEAYDAAETVPTCEGRLQALYGRDQRDYFADNCHACGDTDDASIVCEVFSPDGDVLGLCTGEAE